MSDGLDLGQSAAHGFVRLTGAQRVAGAVGVLGVLQNGKRVLPDGSMFESAADGLFISAASGNTLTLGPDGGLFVQQVWSGTPAW